MKEQSKKWKHDELAEDLAKHLGNNTDRMIWTDMQLGPSGSPRPDVFTAPKSYSKFLPIAYECKVSVSDFRQDITKGKWQSYLKYASGVIFAVPKGLIDKDDVPKGCGLIVRSESCWRMVKGPTLTPIANDLPKEFWIKMLIDGVGRTVHSRRFEQAFEHRARKVISAKYGEELGQALQRRDNAQSRLDYKTEELRKRLGDLNFIESAERERQSLESDKQAYETLHHELCDLLGISPQSHIWEVQRAFKRQKELLSKDAHVGACQSAMNGILRDLKSQVEKVEQFCTLAPSDAEV